MADESVSHAADRQSIRRWAKVRLWAGYVYLLCAVIFAYPQTVRVIVGLVLIIIGAAIRLIASSTLVKDRELCIQGIYSLTRNPLYLGSALVGLGFAVLASSIWILLGYIVVLVPIYWRMIVLEERYLLKLFPDAYSAYRKSVPAFFPAIKPSAWIPTTMDRERLVGSRELISTLAFLLLAAILLIWHRSWLPL